MKISKRTTVIVGLMAVSAGCGGGGGAGTGGSSSTTGEGGAISSSTTGMTASTSTAGTGGGGATGSSSSSSSATTGSGPCTPKTCLTLAVEMTAAAGITDPMPDACGILSDGCANFVDCGGCDNPDRACGQGHYSTTTQLLPGVPNLCGGDCTKSDKGSGGVCESALDSIYWCANNPLNLPQSLKANCYSGFPGVPSAAWCCPP